MHADLGHILATLEGEGASKGSEDDGAQPSGSTTRSTSKASSPTQRVATALTLSTRAPSSEMFEETRARVSSDGTVYWSRPGVLELLCQFSGLVSFPYDELGCRIEIGGWILSGEHQGVHAHNGVGAVLDKQEASARTSYQELEFVSVISSEVVYACDHHGA